MRQILYIKFIMLILLLTSGCSNEVIQMNFSQKESVTSTINILWDESSGVDERVVLDLLERKYPDATFEIMLFRHPIHESERNITKLMKTGIEADLVFFESTIASVFANIEVFEPLDGLMVEAKLQEATFETPALEFIRGHDQDNRLLALPLGKNVYALYYNKEAFTRYGVALPKDGMSWSEVLELAQKLGQSPDFRETFVLTVVDPHLIPNQLGLTYGIDGESQFNSPEWEHAFNLYTEIAGIERNELYKYTSQTMFGPDYSFFAKGQAVMAIGGYIGNRGELPPPFYGFRRGPDDDWDLVSYPTFNTNIAPFPTFYYLGITKNSAHKSDVLKVLAYLLSEEAQKELSRSGLASAHANQLVNQDYGMYLEEFADKNASAYFRYNQYSSIDFSVDYNVRYHLSPILDHLYIGEQEPHFTNIRNLYINELSLKWVEAVKKSKNDINAINKS